MNCLLMFIISNCYGRKCLSNFVHLECWSVSFKVIYDNINAQMNCALMFIMSNDHGRKCLTNLFHFELCSAMFKVISVTMVHWCAINTIISAINFCNAFKSNCALMFFIRNYWGRKCLNNLLHLEPCNVMISDMMAHWNVMLIKFNFEFSISAMERK